MALFPLGWLLLSSNCGAGTLIVPHGCAWALVGGPCTFWKCVSGTGVRIVVCWDDYLGGSDMTGVAP
eukprot:6059161-Ditylum_brightwellii.AAC.1